MSQGAFSSIDSSIGNLRIRLVAGRIGGEVQDFRLAIEKSFIADEVRFEMGC